MELVPGLQEDCTLGARLRHCGEALRAEKASTARVAMSSSCSAVPAPTPTAPTMSPFLVSTNPPPNMATDRGRAAATDAGKFARTLVGIPNERAVHAFASVMLTAAGGQAS